MMKSSQKKNSKKKKIKYYNKKDDPSAKIRSSKIEKTQLESTIKVNPFVYFNYTKFYTKLQ